MSALESLSPKINIEIFARGGSDGLTSSSGRGVILHECENGTE